jgi:hypothetical protein
MREPSARPSASDSKIYFAFSRRVGIIAAQLSAISVFYFVSEKIVVVANAHLKRISGARHQRLLSVVIIVLAGLFLLSCGSSHAVLEVAAPATVVAGSPFSVTVTAMYQGKRDTIINGPIHFTTTDTAAQLPTLYVFTAADAGSHTFTDLTLVTPGSQTITVSDYDATPIAGTANIMVSAAGDAR